jgi:WD40 repeat protein
MALGVCLLACAATAVPPGVVAAREAQDAAKPVVAAADLSVPCSLPQPSFNSSSENIFNDQQEQYLADALAEAVESDLRVAAPADDDQLTRIGEKLLAVLPPTGLHYRFRVYDSGEINGFSIGGGRVYISRKMIAAVKNEDELAGVLAHEIGHIATHQEAIEFTRRFRVKLGVTEVSDRADIVAKLHRDQSTPYKRGAEVNTEKKDQLAADHVGLYALVRAGYAPGSFTSFMNESMANNGKTGNWLSDVMGSTRESSLRYRTALQLIGELPAGCAGRKPAASEAFLAWQRGVVEERVKLVASGASGDRQVKLDPTLRPDLWHIKFSPDGKLVLAQDDGSITVVDRVARKVLFRFDAPDANAAQFTPDSESIVFDDKNLRVERWSVATGKRTSVKELVVFDGCYQPYLLPDGKALACASVDVDGGMPVVRIRLFDVESGTAFYEKKRFFAPDFNDSRIYTLIRAANGLPDLAVARFEVSQEGRYLLVRSGSQSLGYDLSTRQQIPLTGKVKAVAGKYATFLDRDRLLVSESVGDDGMVKVRVIRFPEGEVEKEFKMVDFGVDSVSKGDYLVTWPLKDIAVGIMDAEGHKLVAQSKLTAIDAWENFVASEDGAGDLLLGEIGKTGGNPALVKLPLGPLPNARTGAFSPDGKFLAVSTQSRAEIWNLETGKQVLLTRPFRSAWMDTSGRMWAQYPKYRDQDPLEMLLPLTGGAAKTIGKYEDESFQYHDMQLQFKPQNAEKSTNRHAMLEVKSMETQAVLWTREYPHETPACWPAEDSRLVLGWDLNSDAAKAELKANAKLQAEKDAIGGNKKGLLIATVNPATGAPLEEVVVPEADLTKGRYDNRRGRVSGEFALIAGEHGNTDIYNLGDGKKVGEFFGWAITTDAGAGLIAAENRDDEVLLLNERTGAEIKRFTLGSRLLLARIVIAKQKELVVLTEDQVVHRFSLDELTATK